MKQVLSILGLSLCMAGPVAAQTTSFGLKAGLMWPAWKPRAPI